MRIAEQVTFGGSGLNRAAHLRGNAEALAGMRADPAARIYPFWRGKPLVAGSAQEELGHVPSDHPVLSDARGAPVFLGIEGDVPLFAADLSHWEPAELDAAAMGAFLDPTEQHHPALPETHVFAELRAVMARLGARDAELAATARALFTWHRNHGYCARCGVASEIAMAGWQRTCPGCGAHHFPRTDPVVIMLITHGNSVLVGRSPHWPDGMYSLLAGFVEPGETIEAAVRREVAEETGVRVGAVEYLSSQPWPFPASLMMGCRGEAESTGISVDPAEIEEAHWITREEMVKVMAGLHPRIKPARRGAIAHFLILNWLADKLG